MARNIILFDELNNVLELFAKEAVKAIPLKGPILAGMLYPEATLRSFNDLDIWIRPKDMKKAGDLLQQVGYRQEFSVDQRYFPENDCHIVYGRYLTHGRRIRVELHWGLAKSRDYAKIPHERWWRRAEKVWIKYQKYFSLASEDMLIYLTIHMHSSSYIYLKQFVDLYQFFIHWGERLDWEYIQKTAGEAW